MRSPRRRAKPPRRPIRRGRCAWSWRSCPAAPPTRSRARFLKISNRRSASPSSIENRPGAGGYIAWNHVASAEPDGHTLLLAENALGISQALYRKTSSNFDPLKHYDPVAGVATSPSALIVATHIPANTVAELVAYSKTVKGKMNYASAGVGSVSHLNFEVFKDAVGMEAIHIPYKGGGQAIADIVAGHVPMTITSVQGTKSLVESGKLKALGGHQPGAVAGHAARPDHAGGGREERRRTWSCVSGSAFSARRACRMPVKAKLEGVLRKVLADQRLRERLANLDITPEFSPGPALRARLENEITSWTKFVDDEGHQAGIRRCDGHMPINHDRCPAGQTARVRTMLTCQTTRCMREDDDDAQSYEPAHDAEGRDRARRAGRHIAQAFRPAGARAHRPRARPRRCRRAANSSSATPPC